MTMKASRLSKLSATQNALQLLLLLFFALSGCKASDCCMTKEVGGIIYEFHHLADEIFGNCLDACIYTKNQDNSTTFCFGFGDDVPFCKDPTTAGPTTMTTTAVPGTTTAGTTAGATTSAASDERNPEPEGGENSGEKTTTIITTTTTPPPTTTTTVTTTTTTTTASNSCAKCGLKTQGRRVVGGENTEVNEYPWMVGLYTRTSSLPSCGGSLINSKWLITAGHCHTSSHPLTKAVLGEHDTRVTTETQIRIERGITRKIRHPEYNDDTLKNDIALFLLDEPVDTSVYVPVCMPAPGSDYEGKDAWVTGWGTTTEDGVQAEILQELELTVVNDGVCYDAMTSKLGTYWGKTFANEQICAGGEAGKDGCQGDSGGPFVHDRGEDVWELIGVVSWGLGCARPGVYGIYTEVDHYLSWIATTLTTEEGRSIPIESIGCV